MSATTLSKRPRYAGRRTHRAQTHAERPSGLFARLRERFGSMQFPAYVSAFEAENLQTLAQWSDCRTGQTGCFIDDERF